MKKKLISGILSLTFLCLTLISPLPMKANAAVTNLAFNKTASSSANETSGLTPNLAFDGDTASRSSRWSSGSFPTPQWISVDLGQVQTFDRVRIYWENSHAVDYEIDVSNDNKQWTTVKTVTGDKTGGVEVYQFTAQNARYVRMYATKNDPNIWSSISLYEMEVYNGGIPLSLQEVANQQKISINLTKGQTTLPVQTAPDGYEILLAGSENQQVITCKGKIQEPLVDTNVTLSYQLKDTATGQVAKIPDTIVTVPGTYQNQDSTNLVPTVIPSLREWYGKVGQTKITNISRIVIDPSNKSELQSLGDLLKTDVKEITGKDLNVVVGTPNPGDIFLTYNGGVSRLGDEGYVFDVNDYITIKATTGTGVFYGTRTMLQILMQDPEKSNVPKGIAMDYPKYKIRGLSLDVGRKFYPMSFLREYVKYMSFYKMNAFQIHLNDNGFRSFDKLDSNGVAVNPKETIKLPWEDTYAAFRLESNIPGLTSKDGSYTKNEFRDFQNEAASFGVNIIPEIDSPAHSLAFVKARPDLAYGDNKDHLDISNSDTNTFIDSVFKEYLDGPNPVFVGKNVHIGSDEYFGNNINEKFRAYVDRYFNFIKSYNKTPIAWAGLSAYPGNTLITKDGTIMEVWNTGFSDPVKTLKDGYQIININDGDTYIVPAAGYYYDYLNNQNLYNKLEPYMFGSTNAGNGNPNILGGMFAVWNDKINNGISIFDCFDRMKTSTQVIAEKTWFGKNVNQTYSQFTELLNKVKEGPDSNLLRNIKSTGDVVLNYNSKVEGNTIVDNSPNNYNGQVTPGVKSYYNRIELTDNNQFINTNLKSIGFPWTVSFDINPKAGNVDDATIFSGEDGVFKLRQKDTGKLGFSRENYNFKFDYVVPTDTWTEITIVGTNRDTKLYVNGVLKQTLQRVGSNSSYDNNSEVDTNKNGPGCKRISMSTFVMPLEKIGGFVGNLGKVKVFNRELSSSEIEKEAGIPAKNDLAMGKTATASSLEVPSLTAANVVDGNSSTRWSSKYNDNEWLKVDLVENKTFDSVSINWENARASSYKIQVSNDDITWTDVIQQSNSPVGEETLTFKPVTGRYVKMQGIKRATVYGYSIYDFKVFEFKDSTPSTLTLGEVNRTSSTEATIKFTSNQGGRYYYDIVDAGEAAPAINTNGAGTVCNVGETTITNPIGLTKGAKDIYIVVKNEAGNLSNVLKVPVADKTALIEAIKAAQSLLENAKEGQYSQSKINRLAEAIEEAQKTVDNKLALQNEIDEATKVLKRAVDLFLDIIPPTTEISISAAEKNNWYSSDVTIALTAEDNLSGVDYTEYRIGTDQEWTRYKEPITLNSEGIFLIQYRSKDKEDNLEKIKEKLVRIDKSKPSFTFTVNGSVLEEGATFEDSKPLTFTASDSLSGVHYGEVVIDGRTYSLDAEHGVSVDMDFAGKVGAHIAAINIEDFAGNKIQKNFSFKVTTSIESISTLINRYKKSGELNGPLAAQLTNNLEQAKHQLDIGHQKQAAKHMEDFQKHLGNTALESHVSEKAKEVLNADAKALIGLWEK